MSELLNLPKMARRVGVTQKWLRDEADAGRVPSLKTGTKRYLFSVAAVLAALESRASSQEASK